MNSALTSFRLIIVHDSPQEAQRLSSMFHNAGKPCRAQHVNAEANLSKALEDQNWDLLIAYDNSECLSPAVIIRHIRKFERDVPVILLTSEEENKSIVDGMKLGACDVAQIDDDQHLLLIVNRELENRHQRQLTRIAQRKLKEIERKNQRLLDSSRDGIAFVQDGMYLYANDSFAEMLGYASKDDIEFMPIMDTIKESNHTQVKKTLKNFSLQTTTDNNTLTFTALLPNKKEKEISAELLLGEYDEEPCIQFICHSNAVSHELIEAELINIKHNDPLTGLYNRTYLIEEIEKTVDIVTQQEIQKSFILIDIDYFSKKVKSTFSITDTDKLLKHIAKIITSNYDKNDFFARLSDHTFAIISNEHEVEKLKSNAEKLCSAFAAEILEANNQTVQFTLSIGICLINEATENSQTLIHNALQCIETQRKENDGNGVTVYQKQLEDGGILASSFKKAMENNDFKLLFQPIISLRGEETERYEVLLRMNVDGKELSPSHFLSTADDLGLATKIDRWVILEAIKYLQRAEKNTQHFVHLTNASLHDESLIPWIKVALDASNVEASNIVFQAKESDIIQRLTATKKLIDGARSLGMDFCMSGFGSAAIEPLTTLDHLDIKHIKLDATLAQELQDNPEKNKHVEELVTALHERGKITIIPHVEKASILSKLWQLGVHHIQGNYLQPPSAEMDYEFSSDD